MMNPVRGDILLDKQGETAARMVLCSPEFADFCKAQESAWAKATALLDPDGYENPEKFVNELKDYRLMSVLWSTLANVSESMQNAISNQQV
jgi:hypothetical protein